MLYIQFTEAYNSPVRKIFLQQLHQVRMTMYPHIWENGNMKIQITRLVNTGLWIQIQDAQSGFKFNLVLFTINMQILVSYKLVFIYNSL